MANMTCIEVQCTFIFVNDATLYILSFQMEVNGDASSAVELQDINAQGTAFTTSSVASDTETLASVEEVEEIDKETPTDWWMIMAISDRLFLLLYYIFVVMLTTYFFSHLWIKY